MKCPECEAQGLMPERITVGGVEAGMRGWQVQRSTLMGWTRYYDKNGKLHSHNPNIITTECSCSNGHHFEVKSKDPCPSCDANTYEDEVKILPPLKETDGKAIDARKLLDLFE